MRKQKSISRQMRDEANGFFNKSISHDLTKKQYKRDFKKFIQFCRDKGLRSLDEGKNVIQEYSDYLISLNYSASSCHTFLAPVAKFYSISMKEIKNKKIRHVAEYTRGRLPKGDKYRTYSTNTAEKWSYLVEFQKRVGVRRSELAKIKNCDFFENEFGAFVHISCGKGGKASDYYIAPKDVEFVKSYFKNDDPQKYIFKPEHLKNNINLHIYRARHAEEMYYFYLDCVQNIPGYKELLTQQIIETWEKANINKRTNKPRKYNIKNLEGLYHLRGANRDKAKQLGKPTTYSRLCMAATSALNLAHYRLSICPLYISLYE